MGCYSVGSASCLTVGGRFLLFMPIPNCRLNHFLTLHSPFLRFQPAVSMIRLLAYALLPQRIIWTASGATLAGLGVRGQLAGPDRIVLRWPLPCRSSPRCQPCSEVFHRTNKEYPPHFLPSFFWEGPPAVLPAPATLINFVCQ